MLCFIWWKFRGNDFKSWFVFSFMSLNIIHVHCHSCSFCWSRTADYLSRVQRQKGPEDSREKQDENSYAGINPHQRNSHGTWSRDWTICTRGLCLSREGWIRQPPEPPSKPNHSVILWNLPFPKNLRPVLILVWLKVARLQCQIYLCSGLVTNSKDMHKFLNYLSKREGKWIVSLQFFTPSNHSLDQLKVVFSLFQLWYTFKFQ